MDQTILYRLQEYNKKSLGGYFNDSELMQLVSRFGLDYDRAIQSLFTWYTARISNPQSTVETERSSDILETVIDKAAEIAKFAEQGIITVGFTADGKPIYQELSEPQKTVIKKGFPWLLLAAAGATVYALSKNKK